MLSVKKRTMLSVKKPACILEDYRINFHDKNNEAGDRNMPQMEQNKRGQERSKEQNKERQEQDQLQWKPEEIQLKQNKAQRGAVDMTTGSVTGHILGFALPMLAGYLFQQFYSMVDTIIVGKFVGVLALAGVGSTSAINFMIIGFCTGICAGFSIPVAQRFGARDYSQMRRFIANSMWLSAGFAASLTVIVCLLTGAILTAMNTQSDIYRYAYDYIFIVFAGIPATILYNLSSSIIRAFGDSRTPVYFLLFSSVLNIILDLVTIIHFGMGVRGAAYATVASQLIAGILCTAYMYRRFPFIRGTKAESRPSLSCIRQLVCMGVPMGLQYTITAIGSVILQTAVNGLGYMAVAAVAAGSKIRMFFATPYDSLGGTMATFAGQNVGARKLERVEEGIKKASLLGFGYSLFGLLVMIFFGQQLAMLFVDGTEAEIIRMAHFFLIVDACFGVLLTCVNVFRFCMQGMGFSGLAILAGIMEMIGRSAVAFILVPIFGFRAACFASPAAWLFADFFLIPACFWCIRRLRVQFGAYENRKKRAAI